MLNLAFYLETYGCQMNLYDSAVVRSILKAAGCHESSEIGGADLIIINSCAVRGHAEERVLGRIGELKSWKSSRPGRLMALIGCVAQENGATLMGKFPQLDLVLGTERHRDIIPALEAFLNSRRREAATGLEPRGDDPLPDFQPQVSAFLAVMRGCDNFCSYCIVPYVRGGEYSRPESQVLRDINGLAGRGVKDITLVGQNVNSYRSGVVDFPALLKRAAAISGIERVRFITSHPKDCSHNLLETMAGDDKICHHLHLPLQSGSDRVLARMNRRYTLGQYQAIVDAARRMMPDLVLTTDLIAGFPGETDDDFWATLRAMRDIRFDSAFTYQYSPRPGTAAAGLPEQLEDEVRHNRLERMISLQQEISLKSNQADVGNVFEVLVEQGVTRKGQPMGRTMGGKMVAIDGSLDVLPGQLVRVIIGRATKSTLIGRLA